MFLKTKKEIQLMRDSAEILSMVHGQLASVIKAGITTEEIDAIAEQCIKRAGAQPSFKGYLHFPATVCTSVNNEVVHGIPSKYQLKDGDIVSVDCGVYYQGFHSDCAFTHGVGIIAEESLNLLVVTERALYKGIEAARVGNSTGDIGYAIQQYVENRGHNIVREYTGHGIGHKLHEKPDVLNYGKPGTGVAIQEGMVLAIEPIVTLGNPKVYTESAWKVLTKDQKRAAHFEHTIAIVDGKPEVLTTFDYIRKK